jgi:hypothetical protein
MPTPTPLTILPNGNLQQVCCRLPAAVEAKGKIGFLALAYEAKSGMSQLKPPAAGT